MPFPLGHMHVGLLSAVLLCDDRVKVTGGLPTQTAWHLYCNNFAKNTHVLDMATPNEGIAAVADVETGVAQVQVLQMLSGTPIFTSGIMLHNVSD